MQQEGFSGDGKWLTWLRERLYWLLDHRRLFYWLVSGGKGGKKRGSRDFLARHHRENTTEVEMTGLFHFSREAGWVHEFWLTKTMPGEHTLPTIPTGEHGVCIFVREVKKDNKQRCLSTNSSERPYKLDN